MKSVFTLIIPFFLFGCKSEPNTDNVLKHLQEEDTLATQFNPAHHEVQADTSGIKCENADTEMGSGEECELLSTTIVTEYHKLIKENRIDGIQNLSDTLSQSDQVVEINEGGLISAEYKWTGKEKLTLTLSYDGGITEIDLTQTGKNLKRGIYYSAD